MKFIVNGPNYLYVGLKTKSRKFVIRFHCNGYDSTQMVHAAEPLMVRWQWPLIPRVGSHIPHQAKLKKQWWCGAHCTVQTDQTIQLLTRKLTVLKKGRLE